MNRNRSLSTRNLDSTRLYKKYYYARANWYDIGLALGLSSGDLAALEQDHRGNCARCFEGVLTTWLNTEGEKTEPELSKAVADCQRPPQPRSATTTHTNNIIIIVVLCGMITLCIIAATYFIIGGNVGQEMLPHIGNDTGDPFTTAAEILKENYELQPEVEFKLLDHATDMPFLNVTLRTENPNFIEDKQVDSWMFFNGIDLKYQTEYAQPTNASDSNKQKSLRIMISGHPGAGKTTIMRHLAKKWAEGKVLQSCDILFLIHLDRLSTENKKPQSVSQLLDLSPLQLHNVKEVSKEIQDRRGAGVCFLLDCFDGWSHKDDFVHHLFFDSYLRFSLCISTSRPNSFRKHSNVMYVDILGFNDKHLDNHLHALSSDVRVISSIQHLWNSDSDIKDMCKLPLHMVMLLYITNLETKEILSIHTKTQVYSKFINVMIQHYSKDLSDWNTVSLKQCILKKRQYMTLDTPREGNDQLCTAFQHLHDVAFDMLLKQKDRFPEYREINRNIKKFGFVNVTKLSSTQDEVKYTFYHSTFVEYFAAIHLLNLPQEERLYLYVKEQSERQVNHNLWLFFFGLIGEHYNENYNLSAILRQFDMYNSEQEIEQFPPYCQNGNVLKYIEEIQMKGNKLSELLTSAGIVVNSTLFTLCDDKPFNFLNTLYYILHHDTNIHTLKLYSIGDAHVYNTSFAGIQYMMFQKVMSLLFSVLKRPTAQFSESKGISTYMYHMRLLDNTNHRESKIKNWLNPDTAVDYRLSGNIMGSILANYMYKLSDRPVSPTVSELVISNLLKVGKSFYQSSSQLWNTTLIVLIPSIDNLHLKNIDFFCDDFPNLLRELKSNNDKTYIFDLNIDFGKAQIRSDPCRKVVSSLDVLVDYNRSIIIRKLTLIFQTKYFMTPQEEFIPQLTRLKYLSIILPTSVTKEDCYKLIGEVSGFKKLLTLEIRGCPLNNSRIITYLSHTLQELTLGRSSLTDEDVSVLVELINSTQELTSLSLPNNYITSIGLNMLVGALKSHKEFTSLDLSGNPITEKNGLETLHQLSNLRELRLSNCSIGDTEIEMLVAALESTNLHSLNLSGNPFIETEHGLEPLVRMTNLSHLDISGWPLSHHSKYGYRKAATSKTREETLLKVLKNLTQLRFLKLCSKNDPPIYWSKEMASVISQLPHLQVFNAPCLQV